MELKDFVPSVIAAVGVAIALVMAIKALLEYRKQGATKRSEIFIQMRTRLRQDERFKEICQMLDEDHVELREYSDIEKDRFIGFFEELAFLWNSKLINDDAVFYMFSYYAIRCDDSKHFWSEGFEKSDIFYSVFVDFVGRIKKLKSQHKFDPKRYRV